MRTIIILDIDGTLVDPAYKVNSPRVLETIKECEKRGAIFSLNSNRAFEDLMPIYKTFGLNGFIIGENGAFSVIPGEEPKPYVEEKQIEKLKKRLPRILSVKFPGSRFLVKDTVAFLQKPQSAYSELLFVSNKFRKFTISVFVGRIYSGKFVRDIELAKMAAKLISEEIKVLNLDLNVVMSDTFGNVLVNQKSCSKSSTLDKMIKERYQGYEVVMISDDEVQEMIDAVDRFYTVANAKQRIKEKADFVSIYPYAKGVADILKKKILG